MKYLASLISFLPLALTASVDLEAYDASKGMKWAGEITPGQITTLYGDAESIYDQILEIKPNYTAQAVERREISTLIARNKDNGFCGVFSTADSNDAYDEIKYLAAVGGSCYVNGRSCIRMACKNTSGIFLCNDNDFTISPNCNYLSSYAKDIGFSCQLGSAQHVAISGQEFDTDRYNVIVGYANCNHPATDGPKGDHWGPNGEPSRQCSGCIQVLDR